MSDARRLFWPAVLLITIVLSALAINDILQLAGVMRIDLLRSKWIAAMGLPVVSGLVGLALLVLTLSGRSQKIREAAGRLDQLPAYAPIGGGILFVLTLWVYPWLVMLSPLRWFLITDPASGYFISGWDGISYQLTESATGMIKAGNAGGFPNPYLHLWLFWVIGLAAWQFLRLGRRDLTAEGAFAFTFLAQTTAYKAASFLPDISSYPFTLGYSEASRYYYASLPFAARIYGAAEPWSFLHPTRYFLQAIPFAIAGLPIEYHRLWQVLLWLGTSAATSWLLARRLQISEAWAHRAFVIWAFIFILQVSVYYHLLICVMVVLAGFSAGHPWRSLASILIASVWAGVSRVNWIPVPAMLAGTLYFLEFPVSKSRGTWAYLARPATWFILGIGAALASQALYIPLSGNTDLSRFGSSFTADLLWYRLWPNPTYWLGIVPGSLLVALPLVLATIQFGAPNLERWHFWRKLGLAGYALVLFGGGLIVSIKIGGGTLHDMDAFMVTFLFIAGYLCFGRFIPESDDISPRPLHWGTITLAVLIPFSFFITESTTLEPRDPAIIANVLDVLRTRVEQAARHGEVLFIQQRQLLTFGYVRNVPLVPDYEIVTLMEMAMSRNSQYMDRFYSDIQQHRFAMIVAPPQFTVLKGSDDTFGEENDVWVRAISVPLLCEYAPALTVPRLNIQLLVPRRGPDRCPALK